MFFHYLNPEDLPDDIRDELERRMDVRQMHIESHLHEVSDFLLSLSLEQLDTLIGVLSLCDDEGARGYIGGKISMIRELKFSQCPCGKSHDPSDLLGDESAASQAEAPSDDELKKTYGLVEHKGNLSCRNCGMEYVSLQDRMLKPPGIAGCSGCQWKSAHG